MERVNEELLDNGDTVEMLRNNPPDVAINAFAEAFLQGLIRMFQKDREMQSILLTDTDARNLATQHFFNRAWRQVHEEREGA